MTEHEHSPHEELDARTAKKLFFLSFQHSQGKQQLQESIFKYIHMHNPQWHLSEATIDQLSHSFPQEIERLFYPPKNPTIKRHSAYVLEERAHNAPQVLPAFTPGYIESQVQYLLEKLKRTLDSSTGSEIERVSLLDKITVDMVVQDHLYLVNRDGRPERIENPNGYASLLLDPWLSYIMYYGFEGNTTGSEVFDRMYEDVVGYIRRFRSGPANTSEFSPQMLQRVHDVYYQHH